MEISFLRGAWLICCCIPGPSIRPRLEHGVLKLLIECMYKWKNEWVHEQEKCRREIVQRQEECRASLEDRKIQHKVQWKFMEGKYPQRQLEQVMGINCRLGVRCCCPWGRKESDMTEQLNRNGVKWFLSKWLKMYSFLGEVPHCAACGVLVAWPGIEPRPSAVKAYGVLSTGPPGNSLKLYFRKMKL